MPDVIRAAVATGTLPFSLSTKFTASRSVQANLNEYHDGASQRASLVAGGRRTWKQTKRLTAAQIADLYGFWDTNPNTAFNFYDPYETDPPFTRNPAGDAGRYLVRFASDWDETINMVRSDIPLELIQVAGALEIAAAASMTTAAMPVQATMFVVTAHFPNSGFTPSIGVEASLEPIGVFDPADWFTGTAQWDQRTDSKSFDLLSWDGTVILGLNTNSGSATGLSPTDQLWIYNCWCQVTYGDGSLQTLRPTVAVPLTNSQGGVTDPNNAIDSDPTSYAVVYRTDYSPLSIGNYLSLRNFL